MRLSWFLLCGAGVLAPARAFAQDNSARVEALFADGKALMASGKFAEACPKFLAAYKLDEKRVGTLLNLADCYEKNGQLASAWARFVEARGLSLRNDQADRAEFADQHAAQLQPKLSKLTIAVGNAPPGLVVKLDGAVVDPGGFGIAVAIDGGTHTVEASAPDKKPVSATIEIGASADAKTFTVPALADAPHPVHEEPVAPERHGPSGRKVAGLVLGGVGLVAAGVGGLFGALALDKRDQSNAYCGQNGLGPNDCYPPGVPLRNDAVLFGNVSTVLLAAGGVFVVSGLVVFLTAPSNHGRVAASFDGQMLRIGGVF